jgi:hypothetical protein
VRGVALCALLLLREYERVADAAEAPASDQRELPPPKTPTRLLRAVQASVSRADG